MKILPRRVPPTEVSGAGPNATPKANRRVEVTVERESISILVRGQGGDGADESACGKSGPGAPCPELPPPAQTPVVRPEASAPEGREPSPSTSWK